jgi:hypothetical protein
MLLAFFLLVHIDGVAQDTGGAPAFRDITRFKYFAKEIETYCVPKFLKKEIKFWD